MIGMGRAGEQSAGLVRGFPIEVSSDHSVLNWDLKIQKIARIILRVVARFIKFDGCMKPVQIFKKFFKLLPGSTPLITLGRVSMSQVWSRVVSVQIQGGPTMRGPPNIILTTHNSKAKVIWKLNTNVSQACFHLINGYLLAFVFIFYKIPHPYTTANHSSAVLHCTVHWQPITVQVTIWPRFAES